MFSDDLRQPLWKSCLTPKRGDNPQIENHQYKSLTSISCLFYQDSEGIPIQHPAPSTQKVVSTAHSTEVFPNVTLERLKAGDRVQLPGSWLEFLAWHLPVMECDLRVVSWSQPFPPELFWVMVFYHSNNLTNFSLMSLQIYSLSYCSLPAETPLPIPTPDARDTILV